MKSKFLLSVILIAGLLLSNFSVYQVYGQTPQNEPAKQQTVMYTCPMHPEVVQDHPGNCPKCGMKLVEKKDMAKGDMHQENDSSMVENDQMQMMHDSTSMKHDHMKMMHDSTIMRKDNILHDTTSMKHDHMDM